MGLWRQSPAGGDKTVATAGDETAATGGVMYVDEGSYTIDVRRRSQ